MMKDQTGKLLQGSLSVARKRRHCIPRLVLQLQAGSFPLAVARRRPRELTNQRFENNCTLLRMAGLRQYFLVLGSIYELYLAVLADPDKRLWRLNLVAADAFPLRNTARCRQPLQRIVVGCR